MRIVRKIRHPEFRYQEIKERIIVTNLRKLHNNKVYNYYLRIKAQNKAAGKYMVKRLDLRYVDSWNMIAYCKMYFCYTDRGMVYTGDKKDSDIFRVNDFALALQLIKYLIQNDPEYLYAVVNRETGVNTWVVAASWYNSPTTKYNRIIIK